MCCCVSQVRVAANSRNSAWAAYDGRNRREIKQGDRSDLDTCVKILLKALSAESLKVLKIRTQLGFKGAIARVPYTHSVIRNYLRILAATIQTNYCSLCALFKVLVSIRKALGLDSTDGAV